jgi:hypothetical protein
MKHQLDATITVLLISKISSTCFGQTFAHLGMKVPVSLLPSYHTVPSNNAQKPCPPHQQDLIPYVVKISVFRSWRWAKVCPNMLSWSWRSIKLLLLHLVGVPYYFTYIDDARSNTNQVYLITDVYVAFQVFPTNYSAGAIYFFCISLNSLFITSDTM